MMYIAHTSEEYPDKPQQLLDHLLAVAALAEEFGAVFQAGEMACIGGKYHDVGKYSDAFQKYILGIRKGRVDHSTAGAKLMMMHRLPWIAFCIAGHHAGLPDLGTKTNSAGEATLWGRYKKKIEDYSAYKNELPETPVCHEMRMIQEVGSDPFQQMLFIRMLFSCIVDADFLDTENYMSHGTVRRGGFDSIQKLAERFFKTLEERGFFSPSNPLNQKRCQILQRCISQGKEPPGLFSLTVPTGGGKTVSSLAFAMKQAQTYGKRRIIYVIPYTSIIEQTADVFRGFLGSKNVVEHHMNVSYDDISEDGSEQQNQKKLATENWDAPVIVTTNVQFFESLFANRTSKCRKLHNIANSVIVFDEAQMFPVSYLRPVVKAIEGLIKFYGCTTVLCSATQPHLDHFFETDGVHCREIMIQIPELYRAFQRTKFVYEGMKSYEWVAQELSSHGQVLCVAVTKEEAHRIYEELPNKKNTFFLSTDLYPMHRKAVIKMIKERLKRGEPCIVVSTSVISVGVDIDFPVVYLEMTGLDSLIQGAGRGNREGKRNLEESLVHVFSTEKGSQSKFLQQERQATEAVQSSCKEGMESPEAIQQYFDLLYCAKEGELDVKEVVKQSEKMAFSTIGRAVRLIDENMRSILIPKEKEAKEIEQQLRMGIRTRELMRRAGMYMVNVRSSRNRSYADAFERLYQSGKIELLDEEISILVNISAYDAVMGLCTDMEDNAGIML